VRPDLLAGSAFASRTIRIARAHSSSGYFRGAATTLILRGLRASINPGAGHHDSDGTATRPSRAFLLGMAAIGGGPTFIGTAVGHSFTSEPASVVFLTLAAGAIVYVIAQLLGGSPPEVKRTDLLAGFITDTIVTAGGD